MGRQITFHMFPDDCKALLSFVQNRDPVVVVPFNSNVRELREVAAPWELGGSFAMWNQSLLPSFEYEFIASSKVGPYFRAPSSLQILQLSLGIQLEWNGRQGLIPGRIYSSFESRDREFVRWFEATVRWIRKKFRKNPVGFLEGYVGPAAFDWFKRGGTLLPVFNHR